MIFRRGDFTLHSGQKSKWKIELDALGLWDWETLALMIAERVPAFGAVEGVPRGGLALAEALTPYITEGSLLICDDVLTSGASMEKQRAGRAARGVVVFARNWVTPNWITPLFILFPALLEVETKVITPQQLAMIGLDAQRVAWQTLLEEGWQIVADVETGGWLCARKKVVPATDDPKER